MMKNRFSTFVTFLALSLFMTGCFKSEKSKETKEDLKVEIISALNNGESDRALELSRQGQRDNPNDFEYLYYEAQAHSQKAQVDVYSLFPLMKMQVFDVAVTEWKKQEEFEKKQKSQLQSNFLGPQEQIPNSDELHKIRNTILDTPVNEFPIELHSVQINEYSLREYNNCYPVLYITSPLSVFENKEVFYGDSIEINNRSECDPEKIQSTINLEEYPRNHEIRYRMKQAAIREIEQKIERSEERKAEERYAKVLFALYDSIPILKKAPTLTPQNAEHAITALSKLNSIFTRTNLPKRLKENTTQQMRLLSSYLIIGSYKNTTNLDNVEEVGDLVCKFDMTIATEHYRYLLYGARYFMKTMAETELANKNREHYIEYSQKVDAAPEELTDEQFDDYIDEFKDIQDSRGC